MTPVKLMTASAAALTIALSGPIAAQQTEGSLPPGQMKQLLEALVAQCDAGAEQPDTLNCTLVNAAKTNAMLEPQLVDMAEAMADVGVDLPGVDLEQLVARGSDASDNGNGANGDASPAPQTLEAADTAAEPQSTDAARETEALAQSFEDTAETEESRTGAVIDTSTNMLAEARKQDVVPEGESALDDQPAESARETAAAGEPEVPELDAEAQAAAVAESENRMMQGIAAASATEENASQAKQETVTEDTVRQSTEDFDTNVAQAPDAQADTETDAARNTKDDDDGIHPIIAAGAAAFGAAVLADILQGDDEVVSNSGDRVVVENNGQYRVLRNDDVLLRRPGADITTYEYDDGSTRNVVSYDDGTVVETVRAANGQVLRRTRTLRDGTEVVLFDDTRQTEQVVVNELPQATESATRNRVIYEGGSDADALERALAANADSQVNRRFSLIQVRNIDRVRELVPEVTVNSINFETGSAAIRAEEAEELRALGNAMRDAIARNPGEVFLIEGHTDAVGNYAFNLALSDRRAESVALALTEYFDVPPENMVLQGYGESDLLIETQVSERANRRAAVRRITPLLQGS